MPAAMEKPAPASSEANLRRDTCFSAAEQEPSQQVAPQLGTGRKNGDGVVKTRPGEKRKHSDEENTDAGAKKPKLKLSLTIKPRLHEPPNDQATQATTVPDSQAESKTESKPRLRLRVARRYCYCFSSEHGQMIACDGPACRAQDQWYHFKCTGLAVAPDADEDWFCNNCKPRPKAVLKLGSWKDRGVFESTDEDVAVVKAEARRGWKRKLSRETEGWLRGRVLSGCFENA